MKYKIDYAGLEQYVKQYNYGDFIDGKVFKTGHTRREIDFFNIDTSSLEKSRIIEQGMPFLVDIIGNDLSVVFAMSRKYKSPNGRMVYAKFDKTIIKDCRKQFGSCLSGYWIIPDNFIEKIK